MSDTPDPFAQHNLERKIALRWTLRDIKGNRTKQSPVSESDLGALMELELVELGDDGPFLTDAGLAALD